MWKGGEEGKKEKKDEFHDLHLTKGKRGIKGKRGFYSWLRGKKEGRGRGGGEKGRRRVAFGSRRKKKRRRGKRRLFCRPPTTAGEKKKERGHQPSTKFGEPGREPLSPLFHLEGKKGGKGRGEKEGKARMIDSGGGKGKKQFSIPIYITG